jgi:hypothetical protein
MVSTVDFRIFIEETREIVAEHLDEIEERAAEVAGKPAADDENVLRTTRDELYRLFKNSKIGHVIEREVEFGPLTSGEIANEAANEARKQKNLERNRRKNNRKNSKIAWINKQKEKRANS